MVKSWLQKLFWNQDCDVVSNLDVEIAIYNFDLFHTALGYTPLPLTDDHCAQKSLADRGGYPPQLLPLTDKIRYVVFDGFP